MKPGWGRVERDLLEVNTHLSALKRDIGEVKSDQVLMENRMLNRLNEFWKLPDALTTMNGVSAFSKRPERQGPTR